MVDLRPDVSARLMSEAIQNFLRQNTETGLQDIKIVIFDEGTAVPFRTEIAKLQKSQGFADDGKASSSLAEENLYGGIDFNQADVNSSPASNSMNLAAFNFPKIDSLTFKIVNIEEVEDFNLIVK